MRALPYLAVAALVLFAATVNAAAGPDPVVLMNQLAARGLTGGTLNDGRSVPKIPAAPPGVEVDESVQSLQPSGEEVGRGKAWEEPLGDNSLLMQVGSFRGGQSRASFWVLPRRGNGCLVWGLNDYDHHGRLLRSNLWRNDPELKPPNAPDYPSELYPNGAEGGIPAVAFLRALGTPQVGASGAVNNQFTPYNSIALDVWATRVEQITVPAGSFRALKVIMRTDLKSILRSWPGIALDIAQPFLPKNTLYYEAEPPYRFLKFEGVMDQNGPETTIELVRYYTSAVTPDAPPTQAAPSKRGEAH